MEIEGLVQVPLRKHFHLLCKSAKVCTPDSEPISTNKTYLVRDKHLLLDEAPKFDVNAEIIL